MDSKSKNNSFQNAQENMKPNFNNQIQSVRTTVSRPNTTYVKQQESRPGLENQYRRYQQKQINQAQFSSQKPFDQNFQNHQQHRTENKLIGVFRNTESVKFPDNKDQPPSRQVKDLF